jgi:lycopene cyclase domain-containing protein
MSLYLLINAAIVFIPLLFSFEKKVRFYKKFPGVLLTILIVGTFFVLWDIYATAESHWFFNRNYTSDIIIAGLPLEEILFFITVPYAILFLFEVFLFYIGKFHIAINLKIRVRVLVPLFILAGFAFYPQGYTSIVLFTTAVILTLLYFFMPMARNISFWLFLFLSYIPFLLVNYILTSVPVVSYNNAEIWGLRITSIPVEDFFYSFSLISSYILVYKKTSLLAFKTRGKVD